MKIRQSFYLVTSIFLVWGFITVFVDSLVPRLREIFELSYFEVGLVQFAFFIAYGLGSIPAGEYVQDRGYKHGIIRGLTVMGIGCLTLIIAAHSRWYLFFLLGLFTIAAGMTLLQVGANPYVCLLGDKKRETSRLNIAQGFNSLGATIAPIVGAIFLLSTSALNEKEILHLNAVENLAYYEQEVSAVQGPFLMLGIGLLIIALIVRLSKLMDIKPTKIEYIKNLDLLKIRSLKVAAVGIFLYVGSEVAIGTYLVNYFLDMNLVEAIKSQPYLSSFCSTVLGSPIDALDNKAIVGSFVTFYWGGAMIGRFVGYYLVRWLDPALVLSFFGLGAICMLFITMYTTGLVAMWSILAVGFFNSIMFPTIFSLGIKNIDTHRPQASGILCTAIAGGAIIPPLFGLLVDMVNFKFAMILLVFCYVYIIWSGNWRALFFRKSVNSPVVSDSPIQVLPSFERS